MALGSSIWFKILDLILASQLLFTVNHALQVAFSCEKASIMSFRESELFSVALPKTIVSCVHTKNRAGYGGKARHQGVTIYSRSLFLSTA